MAGDGGGKGCTWKHLPRVGLRTTPWLLAGSVVQDWSCPPGRSFGLEPAAKPGREEIRAVGLAHRMEASGDKA